MPEGWVKFSKIVKKSSKIIQPLNIMTLSVKLKQANGISVHNLSYF
jgi:hypothetical protein